MVISSCVHRYCFKKDWFLNKGKKSKTTALHLSMGLWVNRMAQFNVLSKDWNHYIKLGLHGMLMV
ncbi:hypothetical protein Q428_09455 [Fervidicella metallireducens AeB]|uniref:Uncharacterized protein n=1 Tax=Fervidicella metallireducens AeB TaxID=1403537 RepID=A0A017RU25_9CLOT|nr:hypothetical protein Q428_09455 [Fervidicella metallireducens AeB]